PWVGGAGPRGMSRDEVERATGIALPESDDYDAIAGPMLAEQSRMPEPGDTVTGPTVVEPDLFADEDDGEHLAELTVISLDRRVPEWVRLTPAQQPAEATR